MSQAEVNEADIYISDYAEHGFGISSPQLPALVGGAAAKKDLEEDLFEIAVAAGLSRSGSLFTHYQRVLTVGDSVFVVRVRQDGMATERSEVAQTIDDSIHEDEHLRAYAVPDSLGDTIFVAALGRERVKAVLASLDPTEPATLAIRNESTGKTDCLAIIREPKNDAERERTIEKLGLRADANLDDLVAAVLRAGGKRANESTLDEDAAAAGGRVLVTA